MIGTSGALRDDLRGRRHHTKGYGHLSGRGRCDPAVALQLAPATSPVAGDDLPEHGGERDPAVRTTVSEAQAATELPLMPNSGLRGQGLTGDRRGGDPDCRCFQGSYATAGRGALDGCVPSPEVSNEGSEFGGTFERGEGA